MRLFFVFFVVGVFSCGFFGVSVTLLLLFEKTFEAFRCFLILLILTEKETLVIQSLEQ